MFDVLQISHKKRYIAMSPRVKRVSDVSVNLNLN